MSAPGESRDGLIAALLHAIVVAGVATATFIGTKNPAWAGASVFFTSRVIGALVARYLPPRRRLPVRSDDLLAQHDQLQRQALLQEVVRRQRGVHNAIHDWLNAVAGVRGLVDLMTVEMHAMADLLEREEQQTKKADEAQPKG